MKSKKKYIVEVWLLGLDCSELVKQADFADYSEAKSYAELYYNKGYDTNIIDKSSNKDSKTK